MPVTMMKTGFLVLLMLFWTAASLARQQENQPLSNHPNRSVDIRLGTNQNPVMTAVRISDASVLEMDGFLHEDAWAGAPAATGFTQRFPNDGSPAAQTTEVRLLYTDDAIYVGIMAYDSSPDSIMAPLFRRDGYQTSDWVRVGFDSYHDHRTAFVFGINPRGVQTDALLFDDNREDMLWDAVWQGKAQILDNGWSAELRIPFSQLRFSTTGNELIWGVNFQRSTGRTGENSFWAPTPQKDTGIVSKFGRLQGISDLSQPGRLEITPYVSGRLLRAPDPGDGNPFYSRNQPGGSVGGDIKYGLSSNMTLTATINPDFGQVEADPATINLTANESFFSERRTFFLEGNDIFQFGNTSTYSRFGNPGTFYSRRIGRVPQGSPTRAGIDAEFTDYPDFTRIAAALKLSGKTKSGWSVGVLDAFTIQENARYITPGGTEGKFVAEPAANYIVARVKKDFNAGNTYFGGFGSAVNRNLKDTYFRDYLRSSAWLGGVDFEHNFHNRNWVTSGTISYSSINGTSDAIEIAQRSPVRYYNRLDSGKLSVDPGKTNLNGFATEVSLHKRGGDSPWLGSLTYSEVSPGYETNDLGFQNRADYRAVNSVLVYRNTEPEILQYYEHYTYAVHAWNYDGDRISHGYGAGSFIRFKNLWYTYYELHYNAGSFNDRLSRGGPVMSQPKGVNLSLDVGSNPNKKLSYETDINMNTNTAGGFARNFEVNVTLQPITWLHLTFSPEFNQRRDVSQYITTVADPAATATYGHRYVFAEIDQTTLTAEFRLNWTFTPVMSLQTYIRPFISSGRFKNFKELSAPRTHDFEVYGKDTGTIIRMDGAYQVTPAENASAGTFQFSDPDFNFRSIHGNAVFRWEYMPGSTLFLVWQQQRENFFEVWRDLGEMFKCSERPATGLEVRGGEWCGAPVQALFQVRRDLGEMFRTKPVNVFLVKISYWFGG
jgi:hypothetical protein